MAKWEREGRGLAHLGLIRLATARRLRAAPGSWPTWGARDIEAPAPIYHHERALLLGPWPPGASSCPLRGPNTQLQPERAHRQKVTAICSKKPSVHREMANAENVGMATNSVSGTHISIRGACKNVDCAHNCEPFKRALLNWLSRNQVGVGRTINSNLL